MFETSPAALAGPTVTASSDSHVSSFMQSSVLLLRDACWCTASNPILNVARVKASASDAESLGDEQAAPIRASHRLFVAADELGDFECRHESIGQPAVC